MAASIFTQNGVSPDTSGSHPRERRSLRRFRLVVRPHQFDMADAKRLREFIERDDCRIAPPLLKAAQILLAKTGTRLDIFLCQALLPTQAGKIPANKFAHIHAPEDRRLHTLSLSTIICITR